MPVTVRAEDLPVGSVVASTQVAWIKDRDETEPEPWRCTDGTYARNVQMEADLNAGDAQVLRVGTGEG